MAGVTGLLSVDLHQACKLCLLNDGKGVCGLPGSTYPESAGRWCPSTEVPEPSLAADHSFDITTDSGASDAFFDAASDELIYRDDTDTWFKKHGQVFRPMTYVQVQGEAKQFMQLQVATGGFLGPTRSLLSKSKIDNLLTLSRHHFRIDPHLLDECRNLIGCADGTVLDLDTQTLVSQTTAPVTKMVRCSFHPNSDCMEFKRFLGRSGAHEAIAGEATPAALAHAMGNTLSASNALFATYCPVNLTTIRSVMEARRRGRTKLRQNR